ncbi:hypothetical protein GCM10010992_13310 [Cloacibacterium rupense]|uniref:Uncharacterized protein n=1 Tax=Cloacibacterium rupense TaxID=517423 RepID=A0ABQ2NJN5_9FLAO|nr:hypothetical protein GCM10010992_13310 [Cloacibacterium rupense]
MEKYYPIAPLIMMGLVYLKLRLEKEKEKKEDNPMNNLRIFQSYFLLIGLFITFLYLIFK